MPKHIHSKDPRKPAIVAALKAKSGGTKVTMLQQIMPCTFQACCMRQIKSACNSQGIARTHFESLGVFEVVLNLDEKTGKVRT